MSMRTGLRGTVTGSAPLELLAPLTLAVVLVWQLSNTGGIWALLCFINSALKVKCKYVKARCVAQFFSLSFFLNNSENLSQK